MCLPIRHWNSSCHKLLELLIWHAVQKVKLFNFHVISPHFTEKHLAALQEGTMCRLRILHIQNLTCITPSNLFSKCVFYITVLPRKSVLISTSLKNPTCTHWKKTQQPKPLKQVAQHSGAALLQHSRVYKENKKKIQLGMEVNLPLHNCKLWRNILNILENPAKFSDILFLQEHKWVTTFTEKAKRYSRPT